MNLLDRYNATTIDSSVDKQEVVCSVKLLDNKLMFTYKSGKLVMKDVPDAYKRSRWYNGYR